MKRIRPSAIGFVIEQRGYRPGEIEIYANCLDQEWQRIVSAVDPDVDRLPAIAINTDPSESGTQLPKLHEATTSGTVRLSNSWTSGPPTDRASELQNLLSADSGEKVQQLNQDRRRKIDAILAAWQTDAFQWYGRRFSVQAMDSLYQQHPKRVEQWIQPSLDDSLTSALLRVRLGSSLDPICRVLLK